MKAYPAMTYDHGGEAAEALDPIDRAIFDAGTGFVTGTHADRSRRIERPHNARSPSVSGTRARAYTRSNIEFQRA